MIENIRAMLGLGPQAAETPFCVCALVGIAVEKNAFDTIEEVIVEYPNLLDAEQLASISKKLESISLRDFVSFDGERATQKDVIQHIYTDDGSGNGRLTVHGVYAMQTFGPESSPTISKLVGPAAMMTCSSRRALRSDTKSR